jgi:hypothetical protein
MDKRQTAKRYLIHYFKLCAKESGFNWDSDNEAEIGDIVDLIIDSAKDEIKEEYKDVLFNG